jgi:phosphoribosyl 1,2-cyclic phosphodiesterase
MIIRCWGSRGSIPVSGDEYLKYGGETTCVEVRGADGELIVIDAGTGIRGLGNALVKEKLTKIHLLFTHAHWDHLLGFPFFKPIYTGRYTVKIYGYPQNRPSFRNILEGLMCEPYFPVMLTDKDIKAKLIFKDISTHPFSIGGIKIHSIFLNHPKNSGLGFRLEENGKSFVFLTDNELDYHHDGGRRFADYVKFCRDADLLIHDAEYDQQDYKSNRSWGHSLYTDTVRLGIKADVHRLGLFHLNNLRTDAKVDAMVRSARKIIHKSDSSIECFAVGNKFKIKL